MNDWWRWTVNAMSSGVSSGKGAKEGERGTKVFQNERMGLEGVDHCKAVTGKEIERGEGRRDELASVCVLLTRV